MSKEKIIEKIKLLFALAGNNPSETEALAALNKAQELMLKHEIDSTEFKLGDEELEAVETECFDHGETRKSPNKLLILLALSMAKHFRCMLSLEGRKGLGKHLKIYGLKSDIEGFDAALHFGWTVANNLFKSFLDNQPPRFSKKDTFVLKDNFFTGFSEGVSTSLEKNEISKALVVVMSEEVTALHKEEVGKSKTVHIRTHGGHEKARNAGYSAGLDVFGNKKAIGDDDKGGIMDAEFLHDLQGKVVIVQDIGQGQARTVSNDAHNVINKLVREYKTLSGKVVIYRDSEGVYDGLAVKKDVFAGFFSINETDLIKALEKVNTPEWLAKRLPQEANV